MRLPAKVTLLLLLTGLSLQAASAATESEAPAPPPARFEIAGVSLGQWFDELNARFDLSELEPLEIDGKLRYAWRPKLSPGEPNSALVGKLPIRLLWPRPAIEGLVLRTIVFLFEGELLVEVTASYAADVAFTRMGLEPLYGEPTSIVAPPRRWVTTGANGEDLAVWVQIWTWEREDAVLTVTGLHYTDPQLHLSKGKHFFHFQLTRRDS